MYVKRWNVMDAETTETTSTGAATATPPAPTPTETPPSTASENSSPASATTTPADENVGSELFSDLADDTGDDGAVDAPVTTPKTEPATTTPAAVETKPTTPAAPTTPAPTQTQPAATTTPETPATPSQPTEQQRQEQYAKDRAAAVAKLMESYAVSPDDAPNLITEPEKVLPKLMANMHANVMEHVARYMQQAVPQILQAVQQQQQATERNANAFFKEWPELNDTKYHEVVARTLASYRQANPQAKAEDVIREGGIAAMLALRLQLPERVLKMHNVNAPDATKPAAFQPAGGGGAQMPPGKKSDNLFTVLATEDLSDAN